MHFRLQRLAAAQNGRLLRDIALDGAPRRGYIEYRQYAPAKGSFRDGRGETAGRPVVAARSNLGCCVRVTADLQESGVFRA